MGTRSPLLQPQSSGPPSCVEVEKGGGKESVGGGREEGPGAGWKHQAVQDSCCQGFPYENRLEKALGHRATDLSMALLRLSL